MQHMTLALPDIFHPASLFLGFFKVRQVHTVISNIQKCSIGDLRPSVYLTNSEKKSQQFTPQTNTSGVFTTISNEHYVSRVTYVFLHLEVHGWSLLVTTIRSYTR